MRYFLRAWLASLIGLSSYSSALAGAWLQPEGHGLAVAQGSYYATNSYFDEEGEKQPQARFQKQELNLYTEYGYSRSLTLGSNLFFNRASQRGEARFTLADSELFIRRSIWETERTQISLQPLVKLPSFASEKETPRGGSRSLDGELSLLVGQNLHLVSPRDFLDTRIGYRARSRGLSPQLRSDVVLGLGLSERLMLMPALRMVAAQSPDTSELFVENGEQDYDLLKAELGIVYQLSGSRSLHASMFSHVAGSQTGSGEGISVGYGIRF
jgi:hypothetical protein